MVASMELSDRDDGTTEVVPGCGDAGPTGPSGWGLA